MATTTATVDAAISAINDNGQSFTVDGVTYSRANLSSLIELRDRLKQEEARSSGNRPLLRGLNLSGMGY